MSLKDEAILIPEGTGVKCGDCKKSTSLSKVPPSGMEGDARLAKLFACPTIPSWKWMHGDLAHSCAKHVPSEASATFYPLPSLSRKRDLEQEVVDSSNDLVSSAALGKKFHEMNPADRHKAMTAFKKTCTSSYLKLVETSMIELQTKKNAPRIMAERRRAAAMKSSR